MLAYSDAVKMYNKEPDNNDDIFPINTIERQVKYDCKYNIMGRILYAIRTGKRYGTFLYGCERFDDKDYCYFYEKALKEYLSKYGYKNVSVSFSRYPRAKYISCQVKIYF